jgi:hypothetical protein
MARHVRRTIPRHIVDDKFGSTHLVNYDQEYSWALEATQVLGI